jgi:hypothetical protein
LSPDLERVLRAARGTLPDPDDDVGRRARSAALAATARRRWPRRRTVLAFATALAAATAVGFGFGQRFGPEQVQAAQPRGVFGAGFLPADGWTTFQRTRRDGAVAVAANVPLSGDDVARAAGTVPSATLRTLPRHGVVIVAVLTARNRAGGFAGTLPLVLADADAVLQEVAGRTLLVRRLSARAGAHKLDVAVYFGSPAPAESVARLAERELQRLVVEGPQVTIRVRTYMPPGATLPTFREVEVTGTVASSAAGEVVDVQVKECGPRNRFYRLAAQARTVAGGSWRLATTRDAVDVLNLPIPAYYRARWQGHVSAPAIAQAPIWSNPVWGNRRRTLVRALVSTRPTGQSLRGRWVELQRKVPGTDEWVRVRRARLGRVRAPFTGPDMFEARFSVRTRGLTLRLLVPPQTGAPCFSAGVSEQFRT